MIGNYESADARGRMLIALPAPATAGLWHRAAVDRRSCPGAGWSRPQPMHHGAGTGMVAGALSAGPLDVVG